MTSSRTNYSCIGSFAIHQLFIGLENSIVGQITKTVAFTGQSILRISDLRTMRHGKDCQDMFRHFGWECGGMVHDCGVLLGALCCVIYMRWGVLKRETSFKTFQVPPWCCAPFIQNREVNLNCD